MASPNFGDLAANAANLGSDLLAQLTGNLLSHVTDPAQIDMATRATADITSTPIAMIGATPELKADLQNTYDAAVAVLLTLASAQVEDGSAVALQVQAKLRTFVTDFISTAIKVGVASLVAL